MSAPLRIVRRPTVRTPTAPQPEPGEAAKEYLGKLLKMVPGEAQSLFVLGQEVIKKQHHTELLVWAGFCLIAAILVRVFGTRDKDQKKGPDWLHVSFSAVAFVLWLYTLGVFLPDFNTNYPEVAMLVTAAFTFIVPFFYNGPSNEGSSGATVVGKG
jgi:hypothetical protein